MQYQLDRLSNGVRIATLPMTQLGTVAVSIWVSAGSRYETPSQNGIAHFLEHMAFKGTHTRTALDIAKAFDDIGGHFNAYTSREHTVYYAKILKQDLAVAIDILSDILLHSTHIEEELERERGVILQEIAQSYDTPDDIVFDHFQAAAYPDQPLGRSILGPKQVIASLTRSDIQAFVDQHYRADRMVVAVAGNTTHEEVMRLVSPYFSPLPGSQPQPFAKANYQGGIYHEARALEQVHLVMGLEGSDVHSPDYYTQHLLATLLGGGMSSRLFQEVREKRGLAYAISCYSTSYADSGMVSIYSGTSAEHVDALVAVVMEELEKATATMSEEELVRAKVQLKSSLVMSHESSVSRAEELGHHITLFDRLKTEQEQLEGIESVTLLQVQDYLNKLLQKRSMTLASIGERAPNADRIRLRA